MPSEPSMVLLVHGRSTNAPQLLKAVHSLSSDVCMLSVSLVSSLQNPPATLKHVFGCPVGVIDANDCFADSSTAR